ncbi:hypothetical protein CHELA1G11_21526 [Hyphomicrobiales bacterium]|nr:hypothetical protein CHELA1G11_21526 [Hyphomicrobiales bacterium]
MDGCVRAAPIAPIHADFALGYAGKAEIDAWRASAIFAEGREQAANAGAERAGGIEEIGAQRAAAAFLLAFHQNFDIDGQAAALRHLLQDRQHAGQRALVVLGPACHETGADLRQIDDAAPEGRNGPTGGIGGHHVVHVIEDDGVGSAYIEPRVDDSGPAIHAAVIDDRRAKLVAQPVADGGRLSVKCLIVPPHRRNTAPRLGKIEGVLGERGKRLGHSLILGLSQR